MWGLNGYPGGAAATGWAAQMQPSYAPELTFAGTVLGGVPADLRAVTSHVDFLRVRFTVNGPAAINIDRDRPVGNHGAARRGA